MKRIVTLCLFLCIFTGLTGCGLNSDLDSKKFEAETNNLKVEQLVNSYNKNKSCAEELFYSSLNPLFLNIGEEDEQKNQEYYQNINLLLSKDCSDLIIRDLITQIMNQIELEMVNFNTTENISVEGHNLFLDVENNSLVQQLEISTSMKNYYLYLTWKNNEIIFIEYNTI